MDIEVEIVKSKFMKGLMDQNTYILKKNDSAIIIDAGADVEDVKLLIGNKKVEAVLMTHLHFDHFWNIEEYLKAFNCDVYICKDAEAKFCDSFKNGAVLVRQDVVRKVDKKFIKFYEQKLKIGEFDIEVYFTPGHSADCICLKIDNLLFSGDTIFADGVGRVDLFDSNKDSMIKSLKIIRAIEFETLYPGHYQLSDKKQAEYIIDCYLK